MDPITLVIGVISGLIGNQLDQEITNNLLKKNIKNWLKKTSTPTNHDIEKAIRRASLNATLIFLNEYLKKYKESFLLQKIIPDDLKHIKKYLQAEKNKLTNSNYVPPINSIHFELDDLLKTKNESAVKLESKKSIVAELARNIHSVPEGFQKNILDGITIDNQKADWFDLMNSFFIETIKTDERVKTALENDFLVDIKGGLREQNVTLDLNFSNLSNQVSDSTKTIICSVDKIDTKLDDLIIELVKILELKGSDYNISSEVSNRKKEINNKIERLSKYLEGGDEKTEFMSVTEDVGKFDDVDFEELIDNIEYDSCVVFIGQDIAVDKDGKSLHESFYKSIKNSKIKYNDEDGFFMPGAEKKIPREALKYYNKAFANDNKRGYEILRKLAEIPFSLIINVAPDPTLHNIFNEYAIEHNFIHFNGNKQEVEEPTKGHPVIFNILGNTAKNGQYIFTHEQFYEYINTQQEVKIPTEIEAKVKGARHYIFFGIDFDKWYNRLLLFALNLDSKADSYALNGQNINSVNKDFITQQFNVSFIDSNYNQFTDLLLEKCKTAGLYKSLHKSYIENTIKHIEKLKFKTIDTASVEKLSEIENEVDSLSEKIIKQN